MSFADSDEDFISSPVPRYWNNWTPSTDPVNSNLTQAVSKRFQRNLIPLGRTNTSHRIDRGEMKNWIPPTPVSRNRIREELKLFRSLTQNSGEGGIYQLVESENQNKSDSDDNVKDTTNLAENSMSSICKINEDWGKRTELHNIFNVNDGDKVWNFIRRGIISEINFWKNEYGYVCCKATGKISVKGSSERSIIEINTQDHLRKFLGLSQMQWSALSEVMQEKNVKLSFNAFEDVDLDKKCSIEKLWFFLCKRRHFLPNVCILGKLSGAVKLMTELKIVPKIVVMEIRDFSGSEIW